MGGVTDTCASVRCKNIKPNPEQRYRFIVTSYSKNKDEILRIRNANRAVPQDVTYLDWRYQQLPGAPEPQVFFVISEPGTVVGMASLIFRRYWIDGNIRYLSVLGDISLNAELRGIGLGQRLLLFVTNYIATNISETIAFVMPNEAAQKCLTSIGWNTTGKLVPHVFLLDPSRKFLPLLKFEKLVCWLGRLFSNLISQFLSIRVHEGCSIQFEDKLDESFDDFWRKYPKEKLIQRDRGVESLLWRFLSHPKHRIQVASVISKGELLGYVVFEVSENDCEVVIHDLAVSQENNVGCVVALFILKCHSFGEICTIRILTSDNHPFRKSLRKLGFISRKSKSVFQTYSAPNGAVDTALIWALTQSDKDI